MPLGYHISADEGLVTVQGSGVVSLEDLTNLGRSMLEDAAYDPSLPQLLDFRGLRPVIEGPLADLRAFVHGPYRAGVRGNVAVVIDGHLESRHAADIFLLTCSIDAAELFSSYDQALKWLMRRAFAGTPAPSPENENPDADDPDRPPE